MSDYTQEQLREWAYDRSGIIDADWLSDQLRAHADALEENAALREQLATLRGLSDATALDLTECKQQLAERDAELAAYKAENATKLAEIKRLLDELANLKGHAEGMYEDVRLAYGDLSEAAEAYRAAYPKE